MTSKVAVGGALVLVFTALNAGADAITKYFSQGYEAPQLLALSSAIIVLLSVMMPMAASLSRKPGKDAASTADNGMWGLKVGTANIFDMSLRSVLTVLAAIGFFNALEALTLAELFLFVALMPILAAAISGPMLGERPGPQVWIAAGLGVTGLFFISPAYTLLTHSTGFNASGFLWASLGAVAGTLSMILGRRIAKSQRIPLAQVFWPNLAMAIGLGVALPFVWVPMGVKDVAMLGFYAVVLFGARFLMIEAMRLMPAYIVTMLMNVQFVWMVLIGIVAFGNVPTVETFAGAALIILSGFWLVCSEHNLLQRRSKKTIKDIKVVPAE